MKFSLRFLLAVLGVGSKHPSQTLTSPAQFTVECAEAVRRHSLDISVDISEDLVLEITKPQGGVLLRHLMYDVYDAYRQEPDKKKFFVERVVATILEADESQRHAVDPSRIVPVVKAASWLQKLEAPLASGANAFNDLAWEPLTPDLVIVYAEDSPVGIRYLALEELEKADVERADLLRLAGKNLANVVTAIERHGEDGFFSLTAGGDYEPSLLFVDSLWNTDQLPVNGEFVIAVPARDLLFVTGSEDEAGLQKLFGVARQFFERGYHQLTPKVFIFKNGTLTELCH